MRERFRTCEVPLTVPIILPSRCGLADAMSHKQIFIELDAAARLRSDARALRGRVTVIHIIVRRKRRLRHQPL
jgi:hypothetical protein